MNNKEHSLTVNSNGYQVPDWWYDIRGFFVFNFCYQDFLPSTVRFFANNMSEKHLEVAVGSGSFFNLCLWWNRLSFGGRSAGIAFDYTEEMLAGAHRKYKKNKNWHIELADVTNLNYPDESFSTINVANAFHCFTEPSQAARELYRVLRPGGTLAVNIVTPPRGQSWRRVIAQRIINWGKRIKILEEVISYEDSHNIFKQNGFSIEKEIWNGNNLRLIVKK